MSCQYVSRQSLKAYNYMMMCFKKKLCLFDVDGTLTEPRKCITKEMRNFLLNEVGAKADIALVGGSDFEKICEQMGGYDVLLKIPLTFSENGLVAHRHGEEFFRMKIQDHIGEKNLQKFINFALSYLSKIELPVKRGTFIEFRTGLINVSPIGRSCDQRERDDFEHFDKIHKVREKFIEALRKEFPDLGLMYSIGNSGGKEGIRHNAVNNAILFVAGGQISFDVFPIGWDKTYCLKHIKTDDYSEIHFFGDKTDKGGNDYEIFNSSEVIGHKVTSPNDTIKQLITLFNIS